MNSAPGSSFRVIAIDGPAASGKSSVAQQLAQTLGFVYVNSGAMYRAITWHVLDRGIAPGDSAAITRLIETARIECDLDHDESRILIDGSDAAEHFRDVRVNEGVSLVSSVPRVREVLVAKMRAYAAENDVVMEGRDIGSVVFPRHAVQVLHRCSPEIRSRRRAAQGQADQIDARDRADSSRRDSPLTIAPDAVVIDSSALVDRGGRERNHPPAARAGLRRGGAAGITRNIRRDESLVLERLLSRDGAGEGVLSFPRHPSRPLSRDRAGHPRDESRELPRPAARRHRLRPRSLLSCA
jgi:cytidylate kinase